MTGRELLETEAARFEALSSAEQEEELRGQREAGWLASQRDRAMILPSPLSAAARPKESPVMAAMAEERSSKSATEMPPAPLYFSPL
jgi:hypothetical protein